jgi:glycosyltransferase involved in cell wall biosynthesis
VSITQVDSSLESPPTCVVVTSAAPVLGFSGIRIRVASAIKSLAIDFAVTVVCTTSLTDDEVERSREFCADTGVELLFEAVSFFPSGSSTRTRKAQMLLGAVGRRAEAFPLRPAPPLIAALVAEADLMWVCETRPFRHHRMPQPKSGAVVLDVADIEERVILRRSALDARRRMIGARKAVHARRRLLGQAQVALVCSELDAGRLDAPCEVRIVPNTYPSVGRSGNTVPVVSERHIVMVGRMDYGPNREGTEWMLRDVWPLVQKSHPDARLTIAGSHDGWLILSSSVTNVTVLGEVDDLAPLLSRASVVIAPIPYGSGTRVKILEAFSYGRPVVSTTAGAEGIDAIDGHSILIADGAEIFAASIARLLDDPDFSARMGDAGQRLFETLYSFDVYSSAVRSIARHAISDVHRERRRMEVSRESRVAETE